MHIFRIIVLYMQIPYYSVLFHALYMHIPAGDGVEEVKLYYEGIEDDKEEEEMWMEANSEAVQLATFQFAHSRACVNKET